MRAYVYMLVNMCAGVMHTLDNVYPQVCVCVCVCVCGFMFLSVHFDVVLQKPDIMLLMCTTA